MNTNEVKAILTGVKGCTEKPGANGKVERTEDGTRIHLHYKRIPGAKVSAQAAQVAQRAAELGLPPDRYTGRVSRVWKSGQGDIILTAFIELERDHVYRSFNIDKGEVVNLVVLGD